MVAIERVESSQCGPSCAEGRGRVEGEATDVGADEGDLVDGCKGEEFADGDSVCGPLGSVVAEPVADFGAGAGEGACVGCQFRVLG